MAVRQTDFGAAKPKFIPRKHRAAVQGLLKSSRHRPRVPNARNEPSAGASTEPDASQEVRESFQRSEKAIETIGIPGEREAEVEAADEQSHQDDQEMGLEMPEWRLARERNMRMNEVGSSTSTTTTNASDGDEDEVKLEKIWTERRKDEMTSRTWRIMKSDLGIEITPGAPEPLLSWSELPEPLQNAVRKAGWAQPSPVQRAAIPPALEGKPVEAIAETGSGKTGSYLLPVLAHVSLGTGGGNAKNAIILSPTRELALQIMTEAKRIFPTNVATALVVGGRDVDEQLADILRARVVIATPGRLLDLKDDISWDRLGMVVVDEADRMADLGFEDQLHTIWTLLPANRQTLLYTATDTPAASALAGPLSIKVRVRAQQRRPNSRVYHSFEIGHSLANRASTTAAKARNLKTIVFVARQVEADDVAAALQMRGLRAAAMHGGMPQPAREAALASFRSGKTTCLVATDVAGRGIDVPDVALVVNIELPSQLDPWIHRTGRTGRAGKSGRTLTFIEPTRDEKVLPALRKFLRESGQEENLNRILQ